MFIGALDCTCWGYDILYFGSGLGLCLRGLEETSPMQRLENLLENDLVGAFGRGGVGCLEFRYIGMKAEVVNSFGCLIHALQWEGRKGALCSPVYRNGLT